MLDLILFWQAFLKQVVGILKQNQNPLARLNGMILQETQSIRQNLLGCVSPQSIDMGINFLGRLLVGFIELIRQLGQDPGKDRGQRKDPLLFFIHEHGNPLRIQQSVSLHDMIEHSDEVGFTHTA